jgi:mannose-6-phosphate isomerase
VKPMRLPPNQLHRFYRGGARIAAFRGLAVSDDDHRPEDWVGATNAVFGDADTGLSRFEDGTLVRDAVAADPAAWLGPGRSETGLLVKLLDAGERLPVHCHPDRAFARRYLGSPHGKTEAWAILEADGATVGLGFRKEVDAETLAAWVEGQEVDELLGSLNELEVAPGDVVFVPAGLPHAIGEYIFLVELQEASDFSILLEWEGFDLDGRAGGELGLGWPTALGAVDRSAWSRDRVERLRRRPPDGERVPLLAREAAPFFGGERLRPAGELTLEPGFSILVVVGGSGRIESDGGGLELRRGDTVAVPHGAGACTLAGDVDVIRCLPPEVDDG